MRCRSDARENAFETSLWRESLIVESAKCSRIRSGACTSRAGVLSPVSGMNGISSRVARGWLRDWHSPCGEKGKLLAIGTRMYRHFENRMTVWRPSATERRQLPT